MHELARTLLKNVIDPELGLNIIDLGLIYDLDIVEDKAYVLMTFTTMGCPLSDSMIHGVYEALSPLNLANIKVEVTYDPPWSPERMTREGKQQLGIRG